MTDVGPTEIYRPRIATDLGIWEFDALQLKIYGLSATGRVVTDEMTARAKTFLAEEVLERVVETGDSNRLGFVIIHPGDTGLTIAAQWWIQGSVLCQHVYRRDYDAGRSMDTIARPVVACVWELELIDAERSAWRHSMMSGHPDRESYLRHRPASLATLVTKF